MILLNAYKCELCGFLSEDKELLEKHENECIENHNYELKKSQKQVDAAEYLDSFRNRVSSINELVDLIHSEMDLITAAIHTIEYYDTDQIVHPIVITDVKSSGFGTSTHPVMTSTRHSSPIDKSIVNPKSFEKEFIFNSNSYFPVVLDYIGGINGGSGGNWQGVKEYHTYCTFWSYDFPNGIK